MSAGHKSRPAVFFPSLEEKLQSGQCVAFVGAGFSMPCGMPGWGSLIVGLLGEARRGPMTPEASALAAHCELFVERKNLAMAANVLREMFSVDELSRLVRQRFALSVFHSAAKPVRTRVSVRLRNLIRAPWAGIITTNYDELIEYAVSHWRKDSIPSATMSDPGLGSILGAGAPSGSFLVKLHGSISSGPLVLSTDEYDRTYLIRPQVTAFLTAAMLRYHLVFIGCSLEDEILRIRRRLVEENQGRVPVAYALLQDDEENRARRSWLKNRTAIETIPYRADGSHSGVDRFLAFAGTCESASDGGIDSRSEMTRLSVSDRIGRVGATNREILETIACQPRHELSHLRLVSLADIEATTRSVELMTADERVYRVFFLVSIGLVKELRDSDSRRIYRIPPAATKVLRKVTPK